ncbi:hypothetical protein KAJ27_17525 [bacterium]|nr:hypothetical protein [bacterium]
MSKVRKRYIKFALQLLRNIPQYGYDFNDIAEHIAIPLYEQSIPVCRDTQEIFLKIKRKLSSGHNWRTAFDEYSSKEDLFIKSSQITDSLIEKTSLIYFNQINAFAKATKICIDLCGVIFKDEISDKDRIFSYVNADHYLKWSNFASHNLGQVTPEGNLWHSSDGASYFCSKTIQDLKNYEKYLSRCFWSFKKNSLWIWKKFGNTDPENIEYSVSAKTTLKGNFFSIIEVPEKIRSEDYDVHQQQYDILLDNAAGNVAFDLSNCTETTYNFFSMLQNYNRIIKSTGHVFTLIGPSDDFLMLLIKLKLKNEFDMVLDMDEFNKHY